MNQHIKDQFHLINQQIKELNAIYHDAAVYSKISDNEFWIWYALFLSQGKCTQQDICNTWSLPKQTVNSTISNLVKKGYLTLETVPDKRNSKMIHFTESGREYGKSIVSSIYQAEIDTFECLTEQERTIFIEILGKYIHLLKGEIHEK